MCYADTPNKKNRVQFLCYVVESFSKSVGKRDFGYGGEGAGGC